MRSITATWRTSLLLTLCTAFVAVTSARADISQDFETWLPLQTTIGTYTFEEWEVAIGMIQKIRFVDPSVRGYLTENTGSYLASPVMANGAESMTFVSRNGDSGKTIDLAVESQTGGGSWELITTVTCTEDTADQLHAVSLGAYASNVRIRLRRINITAGDSDLKLDDVVIVAPTSAVILSDFTFEPYPVTTSADGTVGIHAEPFAGPDNVILTANYAFDGGSYSFVPMFATGGNYYATSPGNGIPVSDQAWSLLSVYVEANYDVAGGGSSSVTYPLNGATSFVVVASADNAAVSVAGDVAAELLLVDSYTWLGALSVTQEVVTPQLHYVLDSGNWGDTNQQQSVPPIHGTAVPGASITVGATISNDMIFSYSETNSGYVVQTGYYEPFDGWNDAVDVGFSSVHTNAGGWVLERGEVRTDGAGADSVKGWYARLSDALGSSSLLSPDLPSGAGAISLWYRSGTGVVQDASFTIEKYDASNGWVLVAGPVAVADTHYRHLTANIADRGAERIRIVNANGSNTSELWLDDVILTGPGASVELSNPTRDPEAPDLGAPCTVTVDVTEYNDPQNLQCWVYFRSEYAAEFSAAPMALASNATYAGQIPALPNGYVDYFFGCTYDGLGAKEAYLPADAPVVEDYFQYTVSDSFGPAREDNFEGWPSYYDVGNYTNLDWVVLGGQVMKITIFGDDSKKAYIVNAVGSQLRTPLLPGGLGTLYFTALNRGFSPVLFSVDVSTNGVNWESVATLSNTSTSADGDPATKYVIEVNRYEDLYARIVRLDVDPTSDNDLRIDDVIASVPPADVTLSEELKTPGYPSRTQAVTLRCRVADISQDSPALVQTMTVWYRWEGEPWQASVASHVGENLYEATIPAREPGRVEYYFECDFAGFHYVHAATGNDEDQSPAFLPEADEDEVRPAYPYPYYDIRMFNSEYSSVVVDTEENGPVDMVLVANNQWQGTFDVTGLTNTIPWLFLGSDQYTNNAPEYQVNPVLWGDDDQDTTNPPMAGSANVDGTNILMTIEYDGFVVVRFDTQTGLYSVKRAYYQDFDQWQASADFFEESLGLFAVDIYNVDFVTWPESEYSESEKSIEDFELDSASADWQRTLYSARSWVGSEAKIIDERVDPPPTSIEDTDNINQAILLQNSPFGALWPSRFATRDGVDAFSFRYRAAIDDERLCWYRNGFGWSDYTVTATFKAAEMSPATPSASVIARYQDPDTYYEARITQVRRGAASDDRVTAQIWKHYFNGTDAVVENVGALTTKDGVKLTVKDYELSLQVAANGASVDLTLILTSDGGTTELIEFTRTDTANTIGSGTVGVHGRDLVMFVDKIVVTGGATLNESFGGDLSAWYTARGVWEINSARLRRPVQAAAFDVYSATTNGASAMGPSESDWVHEQDFAAASLQYQNATVTLERWDGAFVQVRHRAEAGADILAVDDCRLTPWHARASTNANNWLATEYWIEETSANPLDRMLQLDRSRANPELPQALRTPGITNGLGTLAFDFAIENGPATFEIQRTVADDFQTWVPIATVTNGSTSGDSFFLAIRYNDENDHYDGFVRIVHTSPTTNTVLRIGKAEINNYPAGQDQSWVGYNTLITTKQTVRAYEPTKVGAKSCYLNNDTEDGTKENVLLAEHLPFVQSPVITLGIGEIGFWYRSWEEDSTVPAILYIQKATDPGVPDDQWVPLSSNTADWVISTTNSTYQYFQTEVFDKENRVIRLYCETNGVVSRMCIDNLLVTEPVAAGFDIQQVNLHPTIPLVDDEVGVEAYIGNFRMNPSNIHVYADWYLGTNQWGYGAWEGSRTGRIELEQDPQNQRRYTTGTESIPSYAVDDVVQYKVWGTFEGRFASPVYQTTFENPSWYYPVDLNVGQGETNAYYFVYSCDPGKVWINEVNIHDLKRIPLNQAPWFVTVYGTQYVEVAGLSGVDLGNWELEVIDQNYNKAIGYRLPTGAQLQNTAIGWGFWVFGEAELNPDTVLTQGLPTLGGLVLRRSMGAIEHAVTYDSEFGGESLATNDTFYGFEYIGRDEALIWETLGLTGVGSNLADFAWSKSVIYSINQANPNQVLLPIDPGTGPEFPVPMVIMNMVVEPELVTLTTTGTNGWSPTAWYSTNLLEGESGWYEAVSASNAYNAGEYTIWIPKAGDGMPTFYRVSADRVP